MTEIDLGTLKVRNGSVSVCHCLGPRNGEPVCPCAMRGVVIRDGRYVMPERDLGPVRTSPLAPVDRPSFAPFRRSIWDGC